MARKLPHRCNGKMPDGSRCLKRRTFHLNDDPKCEKCGSPLHWYVEKHRARKADHRVQLCRGILCGYHYPHSKYSPFCLQNPNGAIDPHEYKYGPQDDEPWLPEAVPLLSHDNFAPAF